MINAFNCPPVAAKAVHFTPSKYSAFARSMKAASALAALAATLALPTKAWADEASAQPGCNDGIAKGFKPDKQTTVVMVRAFKKGERITLGRASVLPGMPVPIAANDVCLVKLIVGPGNPGPAGAPSTSPGIGIEVWLPTQANWNGRVHAIGGGGWVGGPAGSPEAIQDATGGVIAGTEGAVSSLTDAGHPREGALPNNPAGGGGDFGMNPDGTLNETLLKDFAVRSMHEQAVKTKALAKFYYGRAPKRAYWDGVSNGGRQAYALAQKYPKDFDGILGHMPAINWSSFFTADVYPQLVFQRDLGGKVPTEAQQDLVSNAAISACDLVGGRHLGYIMDMAACRYDPTTDPEVLCPGEGGRNSGPDCVTLAEARAFNKIWYGMTSDGSVPSPALDNGWNLKTDGVRRWYGMPRGTSLYNRTLSKAFRLNAGVTNVSGPFTHGTDMVALEMGDPTVGSQNFRNAKGNGADGWKAFSYKQLSDAFDRGLSLQAQLGHIDANNPDLSAFKARGGKLLTWHGMHDEAIPVQGSMRYFDQVAARMGGIDQTQSFYRLYVIPGIGHATPNGTANPAATPPIPDRNAFYELMVAWVERGQAPGRLTLTSLGQPAARITQPICPYPQRATYVKGDPRVAEAYVCQ